MSITPAISAGTNLTVASPKKAVRNVPTVNGSVNVAPPNGTSAVIAWPANFVIVTGSEMLAPMPKVPEKEAPENQSNRKKRLVLIILIIVLTHTIKINKYMFVYIQQST